MCETNLLARAASMRPRHTAAENELIDYQTAYSLSASMRPRHTAAENERGLREGPSEEGGFNEAAAYSRGKQCFIAWSSSDRLGFNEAAAYSRGKPHPGWMGVRVQRGASMRPRHTAAENAHPSECPSTLVRCFNEAAAYSRGKRRGGCEVRLAGRHASMRPRHTAAENCPGRHTLSAGHLCFNEAAAYSRGKRASSPPTSKPMWGFNEAAAYSRGKPLSMDESRCPVLWLQ